MGTKASAFVSTAMGEGTTASGFVSTAMGEFTEASGSFSTAMGWDTVAQDFGATAIGTFNETKETPNPESFTYQNTAFVIGNGGYDSEGNYDGHRSNALEVFLTALPPLQETSTSTQMHVSKPTSFL